MTARALLAVAAATAAAGCGGQRVEVAAAQPVAVERDVEWRRVATDVDRLRLRNWRTTWLAALVEARAADAAEVARQGALLDPDRALVDPVPPAGVYRCRTFKLGVNGTATRGFTNYPWFECRVTATNGQVRLVKTSGSQRPDGVIFADGLSRAVFLGALALGDEGAALAYGRDRNRDLAGLVERVGPARWRIAFPEPRFESRLDVIELIPAG